MDIKTQEKGTLPVFSVVCTSRIFPAAEHVQAGSTLRDPGSSWDEASSC